MDVAFKYLISEYYSRDMSIKTKTAKYAKMQRGEYQSTICPYGYRKSADGRMEPDPEAAAVVLLIFQLAAEGKNAPSIARELYKRGIPTPAEYKIAKGQKTHDVSRTHGIWCDSTIVRYLADERYTGTYIIGKRAVLEVGGNNSRFKDRSKWYIIPDHHPAIVDKALFDKVQETVRRFSQPHKQQRDYLLKGIVFCGCCDHALSYIANKRPYFVCRRSQAAENGPCHDLKVAAEELEQVIFQTIKAQLKAVLSIRTDGSICLDTVFAERTEYEKQIEALEDSKQSLFEQYIMGEIDVEAYKSEKVICACCGGKMQRKRGTNHADWYFFTCITKNRLGADKCTGMYAREEDVLSAVYYQLKQYIDHHFITKDQYQQEIQHLNSIVEAASLKYEEATDFSMKQYEKYIMGEGPKEAIAAARPAKEQAEAELNRAIADKEAYEKQYQVFCKLLKASRKEIPLSEIIDCIEQIVVDVDRKIMVKWTE